MFELYKKFRSCPYEMTENYCISENSPMERQAKDIFSCSVKKTPTNCINTYFTPIGNKIHISIKLKFLTRKIEQFICLHYELFK